MTNGADELAWSSAVEEADWIRDQLAPFDAHQVTSVVPGGFEAYARLLHPAEEPGLGDRLVRWAEVAAWSGMPLRANAQFHSIALPPVRPPDRAPWSGQGPRAGSLYRPDAEVLAETGRRWTGTPGQCWFCVWDGFGQFDIRTMAPPGQGSGWLPDPVAGTVRHGPRVQLPQRDYFIYHGPAEAALAAPGQDDEDQTANLWWPQDRAWCVASEIDLPWTYIGGPAGLIEALLADPRIEALPAGPDDPVNRVEDWVTRWAEQATADALQTGETAITTCRGTIRVWLEPPSRLRRAVLRTQVTGDNGVSASGRTMLGHRGNHDLTDEVNFYLTYAVIQLVGG